MLTNRERWLMDAAFMEGYDSGHINGRRSIKYGFPTARFSDWLVSDAGDGVTVEMVLEKDAPEES